MESQGNVLTSGPKLVDETSSIAGELQGASLFGSLSTLNNTSLAVIPMQVSQRTFQIDMHKAVSCILTDTLLIPSRWKPILLLTIPLQCLTLTLQFKVGLRPQILHRKLPAGRIDPDNLRVGLTSMLPMHYRI
jgi:hypothetical protein